MSRTQITRSRLQAEALRLITDRGFDNVTVEEIANAAGVSHMTFFRHFPTKESVVLDDTYDPLIADMIIAQDRDLPALERVRRGLLAAWSKQDELMSGETRQRIRLAAGHAGLRARVWQNNQRTEDIISKALVADGVPPLHARVAAGAVLGALTAALFEWGCDNAGESLTDRVLTALDLLSRDRPTS